MTLRFLLAVSAVLVGGDLQPAQGAGVRVVSPVMEQILPGPDVPVMVQTEGYQFMPGGCNLHIILDDGPFAVQYDPTHPYLLRDVAPGSHTLRVFVADRLHRAIPGTLDLIVFSVGYQDEYQRPSQGVPVLTVNLPQGEYLGVDAGDVAIDFMVDGVNLSRRGYHVAYHVDGRRFYAYNEGARHLKGLPPGFHTVRFELLDERGKLVNGPYASLERVILLSPDKTRHTPTEEDVWRGLPIMESIPGAMTNGQPWIAGNPTPLRMAQANPVGVAGTGRTGAGVAVAASAGAAATAADAAPGAYGAVDAAPGAGFTVRPGGRRAGPLPQVIDETVQETEEVVPAVPADSFPPAEPETLSVAPGGRTTRATRTETVETETVEKQGAVESDAATENGARGETGAKSTTVAGDGLPAGTGTAGGTGATSRKGPSADKEDGATTTARDLRPAAFRDQPAPVTQTVKVDSFTTGSDVKRVSTPTPMATPAPVTSNPNPSGAGVTSATVTPATELGPVRRTPRADRSPDRGADRGGDRSSRAAERRAQRGVPGGKAATTDDAAASPDNTATPAEPAAGRVGP